jgi:hypothetical protein
MAKYHLAIFHVDYEPHSNNPTEFHQVLSGIRELSTNELRNLRRYINKIIAYIENKSLFTALTLNFRDFENACSLYFRNYHETQSMNWDMMEQISMNLGRLLLNISLLFRCFLDHTETTLKRRFGKESETVKKWKEATSRCYDKSFAYRFMYHLRNYGQHVGVPPLNIQISSMGNEPLIDTHTIISKFHIAIQTQPLLREKDVFKKVLMTEISSYGKFIDLMPILDEWFVQVSELFKIREKIEIRSAKKAAKIIVSLRKEISPPEDSTMCILTIPNNHKNNELSPRMKWFPEREAQSILRQLRS